MDRYHIDRWHPKIAEAEANRKEASSKFAATEKQKEQHRRDIRLGWTVFIIFVVAILCVIKIVKGAQ